MFGTLRAVEIDGEPWFVLADVAKSLGHRRTADAKAHLRDSQCNTAPASIKADLGILGKSPTLVTESGVYRLIMKSSAPNADAFQDWVTDEVLPTIRRTGSYDVQADDAPADVRELFASLSDKIDAMAPAVKAHHEIEDTSRGQSLAQTARRMGIGHHKLCAILRAEGVLADPHNAPTKFGVSMGYVADRNRTAAVPEASYEALRTMVTQHLVKHYTD
ncbi:BRO family protein [Streptomyces sp. NPDC007063]|uniref:BRO family protein n=1 Tax=Streptomyces sp. NPDC007063 TaxID=3364772 RepID=UPI003691484F